MNPIRIFAGYDKREAVGFAVFVQSVIERASRPVSITPLAAEGMPTGSNAFTMSRFLTPWLCGFQGHAIFLDGSDMLCEGDVAELDALYNPFFAVQCVKHPDYETRHPRKYVGTPMECDNRNYHCKNWASTLIFNNEHKAWAGMTPERLAERSALSCLQLATCLDDEIGELPREWNVLADEGQETEGAKLLHFTAGLPLWPAYRNTPGAREWLAVHSRIM